MRFRHTGITIVTPTNWGTISREPVYRDEEGLFLGGGMATVRRIGSIEVGQIVHDAYGHLGPGVVVRASTPSWLCTGVVLLDEDTPNRQAVVDLVRGEQS